MFFGPFSSIAIEKGGQMDLEHWTLDCLTSGRNRSQHRCAPTFELGEKGGALPLRPWLGSQFSRDVGAVRRCEWINIVSDLLLP